MAYAGGRRWLVLIGWGRALFGSRGCREFRSRPSWLVVARPFSMGMVMAPNMSADVANEIQSASDEFVNSSAHHRSPHRQLEYDEYAEPILKISKQEPGINGKEHEEQTYDDLHLWIGAHVLNLPPIELCSAIGTPNQPHLHNPDINIIIVKTPRPGCIW